MPLPLPAPPAPPPGRSGRDRLLITVLPPTAAKLMAKASAAQLRTWEKVRNEEVGGGAPGASHAAVQPRGEAPARGVHYWPT